MTARLATIWLLWLLIPAYSFAQNPYYDHGSYPAPGSLGSSAGMRAELDLIEAGFSKLPTLSGNSNKVVVVNSGGTALTVTDAPIQNGTTFPSAPGPNAIFLVTDDSVVGACDSAAGSSVTLCRWDGSAWVAISSTSATPGLSQVGSVDRTYGEAVSQATGIRIGSDAAGAYLNVHYDSTAGLQYTCEIAGVLDDCHKAFKLLSGKKFRVTDAAGTALVDFEPNASASYDQYKLGAKKILSSVDVPLEVQSGAATMALVQPVSGQAKAYWGTLTDSTSDALAFSFLADKKMEGATTVTIRLTGKSTAATPSGDIQLECAVQSTRPGVDTSGTHPTTNKQAITLTPAVQNRDVSTVSSDITINGTVAAGAIIDGVCNVNATNTTSVQLANFYLYGQAQISWSQSSLSN